MLFISWSVIKIYGLSNTHSCFLWSFINSLEEYPLSIFIPLIISTYVDVVMLFSTVTMSTSLNASAIILPTSLSLLALIVATSISFFPLNFFDFLSSLPTMLLVILLISRITSVTFSFSDKYLSAASIIASANTILVVVPSPATVAVRSAA